MQQSIFGQQTTAVVNPLNLTNPNASTSNFGTGNTGGFGSQTASTNSLTGGGLFGQSSTPSFGTGSSSGFGTSSTTSSGSATSILGSLSSQTPFSTSSCYGQVNSNSLTIGGQQFILANPTSTAGITGSSLFNVNSPAPNSTGGLFGQTADASKSGLFAPPASTAAVGGNLFGQPSATPPAGGGLFGQPSATPPTGGGLFGQPSATPPVGGGLFGQSTATPSAGGGLFGQPAATPSSGGGLFGQPTATPSTGGGLFGQPTATSTVGGGLFGQPAATPSSGGGLFGQTSATSTGGGLFGVTSTTPLAGGGLFGQTSATPSSGLFSQTNTGGGGLLGLSNSSTNATGLNLGPSTSSTSNLGLGGSLPSSTTTSVAGLGGFQPPTIDSGIGTNATKGDGKCAKEAPLPNDIFGSIAIFENHRDSEKKASEENVRQTAAPFHKLGEDAKKLRQHIVKLSNQHAQLHASARKLKSSVIQEAENAEMGRRTQETPIALQGDNRAPEQFFLRLIRSFEERMTYSKNKIDEVEKCSQNNGSNTAVTSEDMKTILKKEHEMIKALAARVYTLHNQLLNHCNKISSQTKPEAFFKPHSPEQHGIGISHKNSTVLRPCVGDTESGLLHFQNGQQMAKAVSLGATPPVVMPLGQTSVPNILGSANQSTLFNSPSSNNFGSNNNMFNKSSTTPLFGFNSPSSTNTLNFGSGSSGLNFNTGSVVPSPFGSPKPFGKSSGDFEESHRKRRM